MEIAQSLFTRTDFVFLPIESFEKAEEFYSGVLGLPCSARYKDSLGGEFETGSLTIQVVDAAKIGREFEPSKGASHCTWTTSGQRGRSSSHAA